MERIRLDDQFVRQLLPYDINTFVEIVRAPARSELHQQRPFGGLMCMARLAAAASQQTGWTSPAR